MTKPGATALNTRPNPKRPEQESEMVTLNDAFPSKYLKAADLAQMAPSLQRLSSPSLKR
jgi:hypothetical protein